jgi:hypothetical protein
MVTGLLSELFVERAASCRMGRNIAAPVRLPRRGWYPGAALTRARRGVAQVFLLSLG